MTTGGPALDRSPPRVGQHTDEVLAELGYDPAETARLRDAGRGRMIRAAPLTLTAEPFATLPDALHHRGTPSAWARMTRPGQPMHSFLESAFFDDDRSLWLSDVPYGRVFRVAPDGGWRVEHDYDGAPHAMRILPDGRRVAVDYEHGLVALTGRDTYEVLSTGAQDRPFLGLSDMALAPDGSVWFTDSGRSSLSDPTGRVYCLSADGSLRLVLSCVPYANGIALSPDGAWVYVAATRANQVWRLSSALPDEGPPMVGTFPAALGRARAGRAGDQRVGLARGRAGAGRPGLCLRRASAIRSPTCGFRAGSGRPRSPSTRTGRTS